MNRYWISFVVCLGLIAITIVVYWGSLFNDFVNFDDHYYVADNPHVLAGISWSGWYYAWTTFDCFNWHPLTWLSLELDGSLWNERSFGYHLTNLILHIANVVMLFAILIRVTGSASRSGFVAAFFAVHPLHVESVAWVSERKDVLSAFFLLITLAAYIRYAARPSIVRYGMVLPLYALGLLAKPMLVTLPVLLLLCDAWPLNRIEWDGTKNPDASPPRFSLLFVFVEKLPLFALAFADGLATIAAQRVARHMLGDLSLGIRIANAMHACFWYVYKTFWPANLAAFYPHPEQNLPLETMLIAAVVLSVITAYAFWHGRKRPHLIFGWLWFVVSLLPVIGLLQVGAQAYADRYAYIPHIGLFIMVVWEAHGLLGTTSTGRIAVPLAAVVTLTCYALLTHSQVSYWKNGSTLWTHALNVCPESHVVHFHFADYSYYAGDYETAIDHLTVGLRTKRGADYYEEHFRLGLCHLKLGHNSQAEASFLAAISVNPYHLRSFEELVKLLVKQGRQNEAAEVSARYEAALSRWEMLTPPDAPNVLRYGLALARQGRIEQAVTYFEKSIELAPTAAAFNNLGQAQEHLKRTAKAKANYRSAIELNPKLAEAHFNYAACLEAEKDFAGAKKHFKEVLRLKPDDAEARQHLDRIMNR